MILGLCVTDWWEPRCVLGWGVSPQLCRWKDCTAQRPSSCPAQSPAVHHLSIAPWRNPGPAGGHCPLPSQPPSHSRAPVCALPVLNMP